MFHLLEGAIKSISWVQPMSFGPTVGPEQGGLASMLRLLKAATRPAVFGRPNLSKEILAVIFRNIANFNISPG